jgi:hypothetical protein
MISLSKVYEQSIASGLCARGYAEHSSGAWLKFCVEDDISLIVQPRSNITAREAWFEFGLGIRFEKVEVAFANAMNVACSKASCTLGCDMAHLLKIPGGSGWSYSVGSVDAHTVAIEMFERLDMLATPELNRYCSYAALTSLVHSRLNNNCRDPFIFREHHYIPIILLINQEQELCKKYVSDKFAELHKLGLVAENSMISGYHKYIQALEASV